MEWYELSRQVLQLNSIHNFVFADAIRDLLEHERGKICNLLKTGQTNCSKTFLLKPLEIIFREFTNPANDKYDRIGADQAEVILLKDFRWSSELMCRKNLLLVFEGENVKLPSPKKQFVTDVCINTDIPIFATSKGKIEFVGKHNTRGDREQK